MLRSEILAVYTEDSTESEDEDFDVEAGIEKEDIPQTMQGRFHMLVTEVSSSSPSPSSSNQYSVNKYKY